jgi:glycosyltransferase involved in cell wall biosynthesis
MHVGILATHPIQYHAPWFRALADRVELKVFFAHHPSERERGASGFGESFDWDVDLLTGYPHTFLENQARSPEVDDSSFFGCDTPEIRDRIQQGGFDAFIVTGWHAKTFWQAVMACRRSGTPVLARGDSQLDPSLPVWKRGIKELTHRALLQAFDGFLGVGTRFVEYLRHYGVDPGRIYHVPHCVDVERFARQARGARQNGELARMCDQFGLKDGQVVFLFVGKMIPEKAPGSFIEALHRVSAKKENVHGIMVGTGPLDARLREKQSRTGAPVHFAGFRNQSRLPAFYALADALVLPSQSETWGLVVNEAMACGTPAIVSEAAGCSPDMVDEGETGYTFPAGDVSALANQIRRIADRMENGHSFQPAVKRKAREHSPERAAECTVEALRRLPKLPVRTHKQ